MKPFAEKLLAGLIATCALALASSQALAQPVADYPAKTILLVISYAAGGGLDVVGRVVADRLTKNLGRQVVVENRPGATCAQLTPAQAMNSCTASNTERIFTVAPGCKKTTPNHDLWFPG